MFILACHKEVNELNHGVLNVVSQTIGLVTKRVMMKVCDVYISLTNIVKFFSWGSNTWL
jgi:hypothetical protein